MSRRRYSNNFATLFDTHFKIVSYAKPINVFNKSKAFMIIQITFQDITFIAAYYYSCLRISVNPKLR